MSTPATSVFDDVRNMPAQDSASSDASAPHSVFDEVRGSVAPSGINLGLPGKILEFGAGAIKGGFNTAKTAAGEALDKVGENLTHPVDAAKSVLERLVTSVNSDVKEATKFGLDPKGYLNDWFDKNLKGKSPEQLGEYLGPKISAAAGLAVPAAGEAGALESATAARPAVGTRFPTAPRLADVEVPSSAGSAASAAQIQAASPELRQATVRAIRGGNFNQEAFARQAEAEQLPMPENESPMRLRKGQATRDPQQFSDERNMRGDPDTNELLSASDTDQERKLRGSLGEIRANATPDIVQRSNLEHGQSGVDEIRAMDNARLTDIRNKYQALANANGGSMPIDGGQAMGNIRARLEQDGISEMTPVNELLNGFKKLDSGSPINFNQYEAWRTSLARIARSSSDGNVRHAAGVIRDELENLPMPDEATANLKSMADSARAAYRSRATAIEANPAYKAVVNDNTARLPNGLHDLSTPSPLADSFMERFALGGGANASREYVARLKSLVGSDTFNQSIEAAALNKLRDAAGVDSQGAGNWKSASYVNARKAMDSKADVLLSPRSAEDTQHLSNVSRYVYEQPPGSFVNNSATAIVQQRMGSQADAGGKYGGISDDLKKLGVNLALTHTGPVGRAAGVLGDVVMRGRAADRERAALQAIAEEKLKFAREATEPGAGVGVTSQP